MQACSTELVLLMVRQGWTPLVMETLPLGVALPLKEALLRCRHSPPLDWPVAAYALIGREDIAASLSAAAAGGKAGSVAGSSGKAGTGSGAQGASAAAAGTAGAAAGRGGPSAAAGPPAGTPLRPGSSLGFAAPPGQTPSSIHTPTAAVHAGAAAPSPAGPTTRRAPAPTAAAAPAAGPALAWHQLVLPYTQLTQLAVLQSDLAPLPTDVPRAKPAAGMASDTSTATPMVTGMENMGEGAARLRFGRDERLEEVGGGLGREHGCLL
jgi:hypothetical protein